MTESSTNPNESWRNFQKRTSLDACKLQLDDLKRLYKIINEKQHEYRDQILQVLSQTDNETDEQFEQRKIKVKNAFTTTVTIAGGNGDTVLGHGEAIFDSAEFPEQVSSILYDTSFSPEAQLQHTPSSKISLLLDFSQPPLIDLSNAPAAPTPNNSNYFISAEKEAWSRSLSSKLEEFFKSKQTKVNWLHKATTYDWLLLLIGMPLTLWGSYRLGAVFLVGSSLPSVLISCVYIYFFFLLLNIFRGLFSYSRWMFPKIELHRDNASSGHQRNIWYAIVIGIMAAAIYDGVKWLGAPSL